MDDKLPSFLAETQDNQLERISRLFLGLGSWRIVRLILAFLWLVEKSKVNTFKGLEEKITKRVMK